jgi:hypothetical protein
MVAVRALKGNSTSTLDVLQMLFCLHFCSKVTERSRSCDNRIPRTRHLMHAYIRVRCDMWGRRRRSQKSQENQIEHLHLRRVTRRLGCVDYLTRVPTPPHALYEPSWTWLAAGRFHTVMTYLDEESNAIHDYYKWRWYPQIPNSSFPPFTSSSLDLPASSNR